MPAMPCKLCRASTAVAASLRADWPSPRYFGHTHTHGLGDTMLHNPCCDSDMSAAHTGGLPGWCTQHKSFRQLRQRQWQQHTQHIPAWVSKGPQSNSRLQTARGQVHCSGWLCRRPVSCQQDTTPCSWRHGPGFQQPEPSPHNMLPAPKCNSRHSSAFRRRSCGNGSPNPALP